MSAKASDYFSPEDIRRIIETIEEVELKTSGEIKVRVMQKCDRDLGGNVYAQAKREFVKLGMANTGDKTGVLVFLVIKERKFAILADSGIYSKLSQRYLNSCAKDLIRLFKQEKYTEGVCGVVKNLGKRLAVFFPRRIDDANELADEVILGERN